MSVKKKYRKRKYSDGDVVVYTVKGGQVCVCPDVKTAEKVMNALEAYDGIYAEK